MAKRPTDLTKKQSEDAIELACEHWKRWNDATKEQREKEIDDVEFEAGEHWTHAELTERRQAGKPARVIDQISGPVRQVTNAPVPRIIVSPVGNGADPVKAEWWQGILRRYENLSRAEVAYRWARWHSTRMGRGFWRIRNVFNRGTFEQDLRIEWVDNQHCVGLDPGARQPDKSDATNGFVFERVPWDELKRRFPRVTKAGRQDFKALGVPDDWATADFGVVMEHYRIDFRERRVCLTADGRSVVHEMDEPYDEADYVRKRTEWVPRVKWRLLTGAEVLEEADIPGDYIPIVEIAGERRNMLNGKVDLRGMVRMARDPQRILNFYETEMLEAVNNASKTPWIVDPKAIEGFELIWSKMNRTPFAYAPARTYDDAGRPYSPPQRGAVSPDIGAFAIASQRAEMQTRNTLGFVDIGQDERRQEQSGRAIRERKVQQEAGTSNYNDGLGEGIVFSAKILMSMSREILDVPRILRIVGADDQFYEIVTHKGADQQMQAEEMMAEHRASLRDPKIQAGLKGIFDVTVGDYDVTVSAGRAYQTARQEAVEAVTMAVQAFPPIAEKALPILFKNSDWPGAMELAKALEPEQGDPQALKQKLQEADQLLQMANERIKELEQKEAGQVTKGQIELMRDEMKGQLQQMLQMLKGEQDMRKQNDQQAHEMALESAKAAQAAEQAEQENLRFVAGQGNDGGSPGKPGGKAK